MIFPIPRLINYASTIFTLVPGDVIVTGTPAGVGWSKKPPRFMKPGDVVEVEIEAVGVCATRSRRSSHPAVPTSSPWKRNDRSRRPSSWVSGPPAPRWPDCSDNAA